MNSQTLREARKYEEAMEPTVLPQERPAFHLSSRIGWMNDPNGLSLYQGKYHLFYQYYPYSSRWGTMHWGHAVTQDLLRWEYLPAALAPDQFYDKDGCFSGNALTLPDGRQLLMYTGVTTFTKPDGSKGELQTQCLAVGDGEDYEKYAGNPVLTEKDIPEGCSRNDFRDPKLWTCEDGTYRCVVANRAADETGQILLYSSTDGFNWKFVKVLAENHGRFGMMWECPDFFELDGKQVLICSPQDMMPSGFEYHNGNGTLCLIGDYDAQTESFTWDHDQSVDYGIDFYAPQTILLPDGRRVMIGWMQNWDTCNLRTFQEKWYGQMSLPREISVKNGRLYQWPLRELEQLRTRHVACPGVYVEQEISLEGVEGRLADISLTIHLPEYEYEYKKFAMHFAQSGEIHTALSFRPYESILKIDRKFSGSRRAIIHQRRCQVQPDADGALHLRMILDRYSAEIFVNGGEKVLSMTFYTPLDADKISFTSDGRTPIDVDFYELREP